MQQQALVAGLGGKIRYVKKRIGNSQPCLAIRSALFLIAPTDEVMPKPEESLGRNHGRGAVDGLPLVERIRRSIKIIAQMVQIRRASVPHGNAVGTTTGEVVIRHGGSAFREQF